MSFAGGEVTMQTRIFGNSGLSVSALGLGCMRMTFADKAIGDKQEMIAFLHAAVDRGLTFFDTCCLEKLASRLFPTP
jgi:aryl-alcohol dehydrogenase-like predicted oxidoreductase